MKVSLRLRGMWDINIASITDWLCDAEKMIADAASQGARLRLGVTGRLRLQVPTRTPSRSPGPNAAHAVNRVASEPTMGYDRAPIYPPDGPGSVGCFPKRVPER